MDGSFHASRLQADSTGGDYCIGSPSAAEVFTGGGLLADVTGTSVTPWRLMAIGSLKTVMESTLGTDLAAPADPKTAIDEAKIQPGHASWSWALMKDDATVYDVQKRFIDCAAEASGVAAVGHPAFRRDPRGHGRRAELRQRRAARVAAPLGRSAVSGRCAQAVSGDRAAGRPALVWGGINADDTARAIKLNPDFTGNLNGQLITDGDGEREFSRSAVNAKTPLTVRLKPHGGFFAVFK